MLNRSHGRLRTVSHDCPIPADSADQPDAGSSSPTIRQLPGAARRARPAADRSTSGSGDQLGLAVGWSADTVQVRGFSVTVDRSGWCGALLGYRVAAVEDQVLPGDVEGAGAGQPGNGGDLAGVPLRPAGWPALGCALAGLGAGCYPAGATALTMIPCLAASTAAARVRPTGLLWRWRNRRVSPSRGQ